MLEKLRKLNPDIKLYSIHDDEFKKYGVVIDTNASAHATPTTPINFARAIANGIKITASKIVAQICDFRRVTPFEKEENNLFHISTIANTDKAIK